MKKILYLLLLLLLPISIKALDDATLTITCPVGGTRNSTLTCTIKVSSEAVVKKVSLDYDFGDNFKYLSFSAGSNFEIDTSSPNGFVVLNDHGVTGDFAVGNISFKIMSAGTLSLKNIKIVDDEDHIYTAEKLSKDLKILSEDNTLKSLTISNGTLNPEFKSTTTSYTAEVDTDNIIIEAETNNSNASVQSPYKVDLKYGDNIINLVVSSESGSKRTYKLVVTRKDGRSNNNNLKSITIEGKKIDLTSDKLNYSIVLKEDTNKVKIAAELEDSKASFVKNYGPREITIEDDKTTVELKVASESGSVRTYTLVLVKNSQDLSSNNMIRNLTIDGYDLDFNSEVYSYDLKIKEGQALNFKIELEDSNASYKLINADLKKGNTVTIKVTAENGDERDYKFNIIYDKTSKSTQKSDFICSDNSIIYYLISFLLGAFLSGLIVTLIFKKKNKKKKPKETGRFVTGNTEILDFNKEDIL